MICTKLNNNFLFQKITEPIIVLKNQTLRLLLFVIFVVYFIYLFGSCCTLFLCVCVCGGGGGWGGGSKGERGPIIVPWSPRHGHIVHQSRSQTLWSFWSVPGITLRWTRVTNTVGAWLMVLDIFRYCARAAIICNQLFLVDVKISSLLKISKKNSLL